MIYAGTDLKYRITTSFEDFDLARDTFEIAIRNRWGQVKSTIKKDDCFYDSDGNYYFTVENVTNGVFFADFRGAYEDDDYDKQQRVVTDTQQLYEVGMCECRSIYVPCECEHKVRYEQVWTVSVDGGDYLADSEGRYIYTSDGKRIQFTNNTSEKVDDMGKVKMITSLEFPNHQQRKTRLSKNGGPRIVW